MFNVGQFEDQFDECFFFDFSMRKNFRIKINLTYKTKITTLLPENVQQTPNPLAQAEPSDPSRAEHSVAV